MSQDEPRENPVGIQCFEFAEFAAEDSRPLHDLFESMGFAKIAKHKEIEAWLYRQGSIDFIINEQPGSFALNFATEHGPCCTGFGLRVSDRSEAHEKLLAKGAESIEGAGTAIDAPAIRGIGGSFLYLTNGRSDIDQHFDLLPGAEVTPRGFGLGFIDHLTHNVIDGNMDQWAGFYEKLFGFYEVRYFDIKGQQTGLRSRAMTAPNGLISIPINESSDPKSQINEYIDEYQGEGVQHIALYTEDIYATIEAMRSQGVEFLDTPDTYYDVIDRRIPDHGEDVERMKANKILIDADTNQTELQLLQIFTQTNIGPIFFEIIQRKGNRGFGEGNFTALFEAIERDQQKRGVL